MALTVAIQMDPIERIDIAGDSTFALGARGAGARPRAALLRAARSDLARDQARGARASARVARRSRGDHFTLGEPSVYDLSRADVVLMRQDPPFDMAYITATHMLERIHPKTLVVNDPFHVRNAPEKLFVTHFDGLMPPTLITSDREEIRAFRAEHKDIIVKPLYGNGGAGVFRLKTDDENLNALLEMFTQFYREPRDRAALRSRRCARATSASSWSTAKPSAPSTACPPKAKRAPTCMSAAAPKPIELSPRDREICAAIGPELKERGLIFAGIDVIGDYLTEINVTSPTGIQELRRFGGADAAR